MYRSIQGYYDLKKAIEGKPIFKKYQELIRSKDNNSLFEYDLREILETPTMKNYFSAVNVIEMIEDIFGDNFQFRYNEFCKMNLFSANLTELSTVKFSDGICVRNWLDFVLESYPNYDLDDILYEQVKSLYLRLCDNGLSYSVEHLIFAMNKDVNKVAEMLKVKTYVIERLKSKSAVINEKLRDSILNALSNLDISLYTDRQCVALNELKDILCRLELVVYEEKTNKKTTEDIIDKKVWSAKFEELKLMVLNDKLITIGDKVKFSEGMCVSSWWSKANSMINFGSVYSDYLLDYVSDIKIAMYENNAYSLNDKSQFNYGFALYKVLVCFGFNTDKLIYDAIKIPSSLMKKLLTNKLYPSNVMLEIINQFLNSLHPKNEKQYLVLKEALEVYKKVNLEAQCVPADKGIEFNIVGIENIEKYEAEFGVSKDVCAAVKKQNLDWYYKCLSYHYCVNVIGDGLCSCNSYFYDGSLMMKWIQTQKRVLDGRCREWNFSPEQEKMAKYVLLIKKENCIKEEIEVVVKRHFDEYIKLLTESVAAGCKKINHVKINGFWLEEVWSFLNNQMHSKDIVLDVDQIKEFKELKRKYISLLRADNKTQECLVVDLGIEIAVFLDSMGWSYDQFADMMGCSRSNFSVYSSNMVRPSVEMVNLFITKLRNMDKKQFRKDQLDDMEYFISVLKRVPEERTERKKVVKKYSLLDDSDIKSIMYGDTRDVYEDVPYEYLMSVEKSDSKWMEEYIGIVEVLNDRTYLKNGIKITAYHFDWYVNALRMLIRGNLSFDKKVLLGYLAKLSRKNIIYVDYSVFINKITLLEEFMINNKRLPVVGEVKYADGTDMRHYFVSVRDVYYGYEPDRFKYFDEEAHKRIKEVSQLGHIIIRQESRQDHIDNSGMYLGCRLSLVRISLGKSKPMFADFLGISENELNQIYSNRVPFSEGLISLLKEKLLGIDVFTLREDQVNDVSDLINIIANRKIEDIGLTKRINQIME